MSDKSYCTRKQISCEDCSLKNYGMDCQNNPVGFASDDLAEEHQAESVHNEMRIDLIRSLDQKMKLDEADRKYRGY